MAVPSTSTSSGPNAAHAPPSASKKVDQAYRNLDKFARSMDMQKTFGLAHLAFLGLASLYLTNIVLLNVRFLNISYRLAMLALMVGYGVAVKRHVGVLGMDVGSVERAFGYDGTPYFFMALMWWVMAVPVTATLLPLGIYSTYHAVAWAKEDPQVKSSAEWRQWGEALCIRLSTYQAMSLQLAAHLEIAAFPYLVLTWLLSPRGPSFLQLVFYAQFLRWQSTVSPKIRLALGQWLSQYEAGIQHPSCPKNVRSADKWIRQQLSLIATASGPTTQTGFNRSHSSGSSAGNNTHGRFPGAGLGQKKLN